MVSKYPATRERERRAPGQGSRTRALVPANDNRVGIVRVKALARPAVRAFRPDPYTYLLKTAADHFETEFLEAAEQLRDGSGEPPRFTLTSGINHAAWFREAVCPGNGKLFVKEQAGYSCDALYRPGETHFAFLNDPAFNMKYNPPALWVGEWDYVYPSVPYGAYGFADHYYKAIWRLRAGAAYGSAFNVSAFVPVADPLPVEVPFEWPIAQPQLMPKPARYTAPLPWAEPANEPNPAENPRPNARPPVPRPYVIPPVFPFFVVPNVPREGLTFPGAVVTPNPNPANPEPVAGPLRPPRNPDRGPGSSTSSNKPKLQKKAHATMAMGIVWAGTNTVTEVMDFVIAMYKSLPKSRQLPHGARASKAQKIRYMLSDWRIWKDINLAEGIENYINMQVGDFVAALGSNQVRDLTRSMNTITGVDTSTRHAGNLAGEAGIDTAPPVPQLDINSETGEITITGPLGVLRVGNYKRAIQYGRAYPRR